VPVRNPGWNRTTHGRSLRAGKLQVGTTIASQSHRQFERS
jgi:hypothetical protein